MQALEVDFRRPGRCLRARTDSVLQRGPPTFNLERADQRHISIYPRYFLRMVPACWCVSMPMFLPVSSAVQRRLVLSRLPTQYGTGPYLPTQYGPQYNMTSAQRLPILVHSLSADCSGHHRNRISQSGEMVTPGQKLTSPRLVSGHDSCSHVRRPHSQTDPGNTGRDDMASGQDSTVP